MSSIVSFLEGYDISLTLKCIFIALTMFYLFFWNKLSRYSDEIVTSPFLILISYLIFTAPNLIALIFFIEIGMNLKDVLYKINVDRFEKYYFGVIRYPFWILLLYCYYLSFSTFEFVSTISKTDYKLTIAFTSVIVIIASLILGLLYRGRYSMSSVSERVTTLSILLPTIVLKLIYLLSTWSELLIPSQKIFINIFILSIAIISFVFSFRFSKVLNRDDLYLGLVSLCLLSILPLLLYIDEAFWSGFSAHSFKLILLFVLAHLLYLSINKFRIYQLLLLLLVVEIVGFSPFGHLANYFKQVPIQGDSLYSISSLLILLCAIFLNYRSISKSLSDNLKPLK